MKRLREGEHVKLIMPPDYGREWVPAIVMGHILGKNGGTVFYVRSRTGDHLHYSFAPRSRFVSVADERARRH